MASTVTLEGVKKAVFFPFQGKSWPLKILIGSALCMAGSFIIPLVPLYGYFYRLMKKIIVQDEDPGLPEWNDWGTLFSDGIKLLGASLIYFLPALLVMFGGYFLFMVLDFAIVLWAPSLSTSSNPSVWLPLASFGGMAGGMVLMMLGFILSFITALIIPPALGNLIAKGDFGAAFRAREWWPVFKGNLSGYILALVISTGFLYLLYMLVFFLYASIVLCFLIPFAIVIIIFSFAVITFSLYAVAYRDGLRKMTALP